MGLPWQIEHREQTYDDAPPSHHVTQRRDSWLPAPKAALAQWATGAPTAAQATRYPPNAPYVRTGFRNPWPSWHKPNPLQVWVGLEWPKDKSLEPPEPELQVAAVPLDRWPESLPADQVRTTWIGHASTLLELPSADGEVVRVLFDPIFSYRCSPTQVFGPQRSLNVPLSLDQLPPIHFVLISHSHYDHLDWETINGLLLQHGPTLQFLVPLGLKSWFLTSFASPLEDQVYECDWWDDVQVSIPSGNDKVSLKFTATPAQHGSGRAGVDAGSTLWCSWYISLYHPPTTQSPAKSFRAFFGGDTGFQFHDPSAQAPSDELDDGDGAEDDQPLLPREEHQYQLCPAFEQIAHKLGAPDLNLLPISVGATLSFLKQFDPFPTAWSPFPCGLHEGLTAANHMTPSDAVRCFSLMNRVGYSPVHGTKKPVALAIHWGTFVGSDEESATSLRHLRSACHVHDVRFAREFHEGGQEQSTFVALNPGQAVTMALRPVDTSDQ